LCKILGKYEVPLSFYQEAVMFTHSVRFALIQQIESHEQADQGTQLGNVPVLAREKNTPTSWGQFLLLGLSEILIVVGQWLKSGQQLSF
jgi:hypothetical protein